MVVDNDRTTRTSPLPLARRAHRREPHTTRRRAEPRARGGARATISTDAAAALQADAPTAAAALVEARSLLRCIQRHLQRRTRPMRRRRRCCRTRSRCRRRRGCQQPSPAPAATHPPTTATVSSAPRSPVNPALPPPPPGAEEVAAEADEAWRTGVVKARHGVDGHLKQTINVEEAKEAEKLRADAEAWV